MEISLKELADFDQPSDDDFNNDYEITLVVEDNSSKSPPNNYKFILLNQGIDEGAKITLPDLFAYEEQKIAAKGIYAEDPEGEDKNFTWSIKAGDGNSTYFELNSTQGNSVDLLFRDNKIPSYEVEAEREAVNVILSKEETYGDIAPVRLSSNGVSAFVTITRGCDNMCTFCVVPFTRGRERSRDPKSILEEIATLSQNGYKEVTLLGQNVDSYLWYGGGLKKEFSKASPLQQKTAVNFAKLLALVAEAQPKMRIRFSTSNPQDMSLEVIHTMAAYDNICKYIHLPVQSGSNAILKKMNRKHSREEYFELIDNIRKLIPDCGISHDMIAGFPTETDQDHQDTLDLMEYVKYDFGFMFAYSERPGTMAAKKIEDDIPQATKKRRLEEIIELQRIHSQFRTRQFIGKTVSVLIEKHSKRSNEFWSGRTTQNSVVVFPKENYQIGDFVDVKINEVTSATLIGTAVGFSTAI
ncbi:MAG: MiaB/RimO family radical SAM methylthiotransferase [Flavobacteriia bacterium]|nr:MiaB/RimO family radical SAM methylthiotransferase [Flavobacteriia bacterium]